MENLKFKNAELLIERIIDLQQYFEEKENIKSDLRLRILMRIFKKNRAGIKKCPWNYKVARGNLPSKSSRET